MCQFSADEEQAIRDPILAKYEKEGHPYYSSARYLNLYCFIVTLKEFDAAGFCPIYLLYKIVRVDHMWYISSAKVLDNRGGLLCCNIFYPRLSPCMAHCRCSVVDTSG